MKLFKRKNKLSKPKLLTCFGCLSVPVVAVIWLVIDFNIANRPVDITVPTPAMPVVNARDDFLKAGVLASKMVHHSMANSRTPETYKLADFATCALDAEPVIATIRAGLNKPFMEPPVRNVSLMGPVIKERASYRNTERELTGAAIHYDLVGDYARATQIRLDGLEMGVMVEHGGNIISCANSRACVQIILTGFETHLDMLKVTELESVAARLERIRSEYSEFQPIAEEDGNTALVFYLSTLNSSVNPLERVRDYHLNAKSFDKEATISHDTIDWVAFEFANKLAMSEKLVKYYKNVSYEVQGVYHKNPTTVIHGVYFMQYFCASVYQGWGSHLHERSVIDLLRVEVALLRFKADNHKYPSTLTELSPRYMKSIPLDPLNNNQPFKYQHRPDGTFLLYGLWEDIVDHHGKPGTSAIDTGTDIVAGHLAREVKLPKK